MTSFFFGFSYFGMSVLKFGLFSFSFKINAFSSASVCVRARVCAYVCAHARVCVYGGWAGCRGWFSGMFFVAC